MRRPTREPRPRRSWRWWAVLLLNGLGLLLIIPLVRVTVPLVGVWWHTRSQASLRHYEHDRTPAASKEGLAVSRPGNDQVDAGALTNQLATVNQLSDHDLQSIVAQQFGVAPRRAEGGTAFDMASAVFDSISKTTLVRNGTTYYGYKIDLVDENGRHRTNIDCFLEPNLDYERSMATLQLIHSSPQLQRIYQAMAGSLAAKAASDTNSASGSPQPAFRLEGGGEPKP